MKLWPNKTVALCPGISNLRNTWQMELRMVLFIFFTLFAKDWEKYCWMRSRIYFPPGTLILECSFPCFIFTSSRRNESNSLFCHFVAWFLPSGRNADSSPLVVPPRTFYLQNRFPLQNQQHWRTHKDEISLGMCWHPIAYIRACENTK